MGIKRILEAIWEVDFVDVSFGFRPQRSCHDALEVLDKTIMTKPVNYVVDMDIEKFFDTVNHNSILYTRIEDVFLKSRMKEIFKSGSVRDLTEDKKTQTSLP
ncbi:reverse transcriptase domain-containing protein [Thermodesulfovibrionales bacterium]|nr:reverse transcriptase domain-containing protein [Thermodesulfovibrionales bacterium]MCL0074844.1 reverse transcriptase domain-containing protein [Thermodesulfovibrionales bacterium]